MKGVLKGSAALTCGPLRCALATALERARSRRVSSRRVSSCCSAGEEEQQETPAAAWCTLLLNILCILCRVFLNVEEFFLNTPSTVFLNVEEHAQLSSPRHNGPAMGRDTSSPKIHEELSTPGKRQRTEWARLGLKWTREPRCQEWEQLESMFWPFCAAD